MKSPAAQTLSLVVICLIVAANAFADPVKLMTLDPGHFHAALVQKSMIPGVDPTVDVYAPDGPDLDRHLAMIEGFNKRPENPTKWVIRTHTGPDYLQEMVRQHPGNLVVISGNNARKSRYILECIKAGINVMADKPMAINPEGFALIEEAGMLAIRKKLVLLDIMTERHEITSLREGFRVMEIRAARRRGRYP